MRKSTAAVASLILGSSILISWRIGSPDYVEQANPGTLPSASPTASPTSSPPTSPSGSPSAEPSQTPTESPSSEPVSRVIDSDEIEYKYGVVQVSVTLSDSQITGISMLKGEASNGRAAAYEMLIDATLQVQGTSYGNVTGATFTTDAFKLAIENVLAKAGIS